MTENPHDSDSKKRNAPSSLGGTRSVSFRSLPLERPELRALGTALGETRIRQIVGRFYRRMADDILVGFFFDGRDLDLIADRQSAFLYRAMGLRESYTGLPPADAHQNLPPILAGHFDRRLTLLEDLLVEEGLAPHQIATWIQFENAFRAGIVNQ